MTCRTRRASDRPYPCLPLHARSEILYGKSRILQVFVVDVLADQVPVVDVMHKFADLTSMCFSLYVVDAARD